MSKVIKMCDAIVAWTPAYFGDDSMAGCVRVGPLLRSPNETDWTRPYSMTDGAAIFAWRDLQGEKADTALIRLVMDLLEDGIRLETLHREFLKIDRYRRLFGSSDRLVEVVGAGPPEAPRLVRMRHTNGTARA